MKCKRYNELLAGYLDNELSAEERKRLEEHLSACRDCQKELEGLAQVQKDLCESLRLRSEEASPSQYAWEKVKQKITVEPKLSFWEWLGGAMRNPVVRAITPVILVLIVIVTLWGSGTFTHTVPTQFKGNVVPPTAGNQNTEASPTQLTTTTMSATSTPLSQNQQPIEIVSVLGPLTPVNPEGPIVEITLKNVAAEPIIALTATLELNTAFDFTFDVTSLNPLLPDNSISSQITLIGGGFSNNFSYPLTINVTLQSGVKFDYPQQVQIAEPLSSTN